MSLMQGQSKSISLCFVTTKDGVNVLLGNKIIISEAKLKISIYSIKPKRLNVVNIDKTISKRAILN